MQVNTYSLVGTEHHKAVEILKGAGTDIVMVVRRQKVDSETKFDNHSDRQQQAANQKLCSQPSANQSRQQQLLTNHNKMRRSPANQNECQNEIPDGCVVIGFSNLN